MPNDPSRPYSPGSRVLTIAAIPDGTDCPIDLPETELMEVVQVSPPVHLDEHGPAVHVMFIHETESEIEQFHALVPLEWYTSLFPLRIFATVPNDLQGIDSSIAPIEGEVNQQGSEVEGDD
jgi:hypothetical protein